MGIFCLVLHTHLPYVRRNGVWPSGEDFFRTAATESYLPVLGALERLADDGMTDALTVGLSPMIAHQMADPHMLRELEWYLGGIELRALQQTANYHGVHAPAFRDLAAFYTRFAREQGARLDALGPDGIAGAFADLARADAIELIGGPATHPFLPRVTEPTLTRTQLRLGADEFATLTGSAPQGMWLPECAYAPELDLEDMVSAVGVEHVVLDGPTVLKSAGPGATFQPIRVSDGDLIAFGRNLDVTYRVWSPTGGYPTGRWYRDFYHYDTEAGFKDWRVTSISKPVERKQPYEPAQGAAAARADAEDFADLIAATLATHEAETGREGIVVAAYDTELFGHWWFEGPVFLEHLFRVLADRPDVRACSLRAARAALDEPARTEVVEGSWGFRKDDRSWVSDETEWLWKTLADLEADTVRAVREWGHVTGARAEALDQMVREAMLAQASDWPFMIIRGRNPDYARERFDGHRARWAHLLDLVRGHAPDDVIAREVEAVRDIDNVLPRSRAADLA